MTTCLPKDRLASDLENQHQQTDRYRDVNPPFDACPHRA